MFVHGVNVTKMIRGEGRSCRINGFGGFRSQGETACDSAPGGEKGGIVAEGRDMGTVVFPDADYKFYLDAGVEERVRRRHAELLSRGGECGL